MEINMKMDSYMPVKIFTGKGCIKNQQAQWRGIGKKALLVTGHNSAKKCGALQDVQEVLKEENVSFVLFDEIGQNPALTDCFRAADLAREENCDFVVGIGGGSPLDAAKCIAVLAANPGMNQDLLYSLQWPSPPLPIVAVGTTAGTGSEVTKVAVITTPQGRKKSFRHDQVFPCLAFGDPQYTMSLSRDFTISTAIDALSHSLESYFSRPANALSRSYALEGIRLGLPILEELAGEEKPWPPAYGQRDQLYAASLYGGLAINITGTCLPHAMGYLMTEEHGLPHGFACAVFLPWFLDYNGKTVPDLSRTLYEAIGKTQEQVIGLLERLMEGLSFQISPEEIIREHSRWMGNGSIAKGWGEITADMCDDILRGLSSRPSRPSL